jgi:hypothetical protein
MKNFLLAVIAGAALGTLVSSAISATASAAPSGTPCGALICKGNQECCVSPGPVTHQCVKPGGCRFN